MRDSGVSCISTITLAAARHAFGQGHGTVRPIEDKREVGAAKGRLQAEQEAIVCRGIGGNYFCSRNANAR